MNLSVRSHFLEFQAIPTSQISLALLGSFLRMLVLVSTRLSSLLAPPLVVALGE